MAQPQLYQRIAADLRHRIAEGEFPLGSKLPGRSRLAQEYACALPTMERAMGQLLATGEVRAQRRSGTVVQRLPSLAAPAGEALQGLRLGLLAPAPPDDADPHALGDLRLAALIAGSEQALAAHGGELLFRNLFRLRRTHGDHLAAARQAVAELRAEGARALCLVDLYAQDDIGAAARALGTDLDGFVSTRALEVSGAQVLLELDAAAAEVGSHLVARGYRRVCFLAPWRAPWVEARAAACRSGVGARAEWREVVVDRPPVHRVADQGAAADAAIGDLRAALGGLAGAADPWAVVCPNALVALRLLDAVGAAGLGPGRDLGIAACDDAPEAFARGLTVLQPPLGELGAMAVTAAATGSGVYRVSPRLVARASTRRKA